MQGQEFQLQLLGQARILQKGSLEKMDEEELQEILQKM